MKKLSRGERRNLARQVRKLPPPTVEILPRDARDRCPKCGSATVLRAKAPGHLKGGYGPDVAVCGDCQTLWEPVHHDKLLDPDPATSCFTEPCDNCAFRPGSPEQKDPKLWAEIVASTETQGGFYCHKGVPIEPGAKHGYGYPMLPDGKTLDRSKARLCRGWLNAWGVKLERRMRKELEAEEAADPCTSTTGE